MRVDGAYDRRHGPIDAVDVVADGKARLLRNDGVETRHRKHLKTRLNNST
jgi:hypothetical protein